MFCTTFEQFKTIISKKNGKIIGIYKNFKSLILVECEYGHRFKILPSTIKYDKWCVKCNLNKNTRYTRFKNDIKTITFKNRSERAKHEVEEIIKHKNGKLIGSYMNNRTKILIECENGHQWKVIPTNIRAGRWCPDCFRCRYDFKKEFEDIVKQKEGKILSLYINVNVKVLLECKNKHKWEVTPHSIKCGTWCFNCLHNTDDAKIKFETKVKHKNGKILGQYINNKTKVLIECENGHKWKVIPYNIDKGTWCKICRNDKLRQEFENIINQKNGKLLSQYKNTQIKVLLECEYGHKWNVLPYNIKQGQWCPNCKHHKDQIQKEFENIIKQKNGKVLSQYIDTSTKVLIECDKGHQWEMIPRGVRCGRWCLMCYYNIDQVIKDLKNIVEHRKGKIITSYTNDYTKMIFECEYGHQWSAVPSNIKHGSWCSICNESHLEREARLFLEQININYEREYEIIQLPKKKYDFYFQYKGINFLLELDGLQHFEYAPYFHKIVENFKYGQDIDRIKTNIAIKMNYKVIRIDYTQINSIKFHILKALSLNKTLYLSTPNMYEYLNIT